MGERKVFKKLLQAVMGSCKEAFASPNNRSHAYSVRQFLSGASPFFSPLAHVLGLDSYSWGNFGTPSLPVKIGLLCFFSSFLFWVSTWK